MVAECSQKKMCTGDMKGLRKALKYAEVGSGEIAKSIESCEFRLTERGFTMLIIACRRCSRWEKAVEIFQVMKGKKMRDRGVRPNFYTYSSLISVCCAAGACDQALGFYREMSSEAIEEPELLPDVAVYSKLIQACHRCGRPSDVVDLYHAMKSGCGVRARKKCLVCILESLAQMAAWEEGLKVLSMVVKMGIDVPVVTYIKLLGYCAEQQAAETGVELFIAMQMAGVYVDSTLCHSMALVAVSAGEPAICLDLVRSMQSAGLSVSHETFVCMEQLVSQHELQEAKLELRELMKLQDFHSAA